MMNPRPRIHATGSAWNASLPASPHEEDVGGEGGAHVTASGVPESYVIREDYIAEINLRFLESEWPALRTQLQYARNTSTSFTYRFDQDDASSEYEVYLDAPVWPEKLAPRRDEQYRAAMRLTIRIRTEDGTAFDSPWDS